MTPEQTELVARAEHWNTLYSRSIVVELIAAIRALSEARFKVRAVEGVDHSTACAIWGDDGQGRVDGEHVSIPCSCGAHWNWAKKMEAERDRLAGEVERLQSNNSIYVRDNLKLNEIAENYRDTAEALRAALADKQKQS